jgi:hypothetical protein
VRRSTLLLAAALVFSTAIFSTAVLAQHGGGGGGGGSSGGSSSSGWSGGGGGGGGSHGGSSGGSSSSGSSSSSHSSGGSGSHAPSTSGSSGHSSSAHASTPGSPSLNSSNSGTRATNQPSQKKTFFSILTYPFRRPAPKPEPTTNPVANLRRPVCLKGPCTVCPTGKAGCGGVTVTNVRRACSAREVWSGGACLQQLHFLDDCSALRQMLEQQRQRMQAAEAARQSACSTSSSQECSDETSASEIEAGRYRDLQSRYAQCRMRSPAAYPYSTSAFASWGYSSGLTFDRLQAEALPVDENH